MWICIVLYFLFASGFLLWNYAAAELTKREDEAYNDYLKQKKEKPQRP